MNSIKSNDYEKFVEWSLLRIFKKEEEKGMNEEYDEYEKYGYKGRI